MAQQVGARQQWLRAGVEGATQFWESGRHLFSWLTFLYGVPLTALYLGAYVVIIYIIGKSLLPHFAWQASLAAYASSVLVVLLRSFIPDPGSVEAAGMAVLLHLGWIKTGPSAFFLLCVPRPLASLPWCVLVILICYRQAGQIFTRWSYQQTRRNHHEAV